jgi:anti-sigma factor RsiW
MSRCVPRRTLSRYLDGDLTPEEAEGVRSHLADCEPCRNALGELGAVDETLERTAQVRPKEPDLASVVVGELEARGAFFAARVTAAKRRLVGRRFVPGRLAAAFAAAAAIVFVTMAGLDYVSRREWARRAEPVLADAEQVLVRMVLVDPEEEPIVLAETRAEAGKVAQKLAGVRKEARRGVAPDLVYLERAFARLAGPDDLPPEVAAELASGEVRDRVARLRAEVGSWR